jgi:hypothetical protein
MVWCLKSEAQLHFWRTNTGAEVDLLVDKGGQPSRAYGIESGRRIVGADLTCLRSFREEHPKVPRGVICDAPEEYEIDRVHVLPWREYLRRLPELLG